MRSRCSRNPVPNLPRQTGGDHALRFCVNFNKRIHISNNIEIEFFQPTFSWAIFFLKCCWCKSNKRPDAITLSHAKMKRNILLVVLALISVASGFLMSKSTWIGKVGMTFFHKGYNLTKIWWQGALAVFLVLLAFVALHTFIQTRMKGASTRIMHFILLLCAFAGLYLTYEDFHHDFTHRLLGWRFHYGFYFIWFGWICVAIFFLAMKNKAVTNQDKTVTAAQ